VNIYTLDPLCDPRWNDFVRRHTSASVFHSVAWLKAVRQTYGYVPVAYTTSPPSSPLSNGIVFCQINSWLTGRRMVSLPFSDHCQPLLDGTGAAAAILQELRNGVVQGNWKCVELRPLDEVPELCSGSRVPECYLHTLDLRPQSDELFRRTHKTSIQQTVRRAERIGLVYECGNSEPLLAAFYRLILLTRRRHKLPPQPIEWFRNLAYCMGDRLQIRVARKDGKPIASVLTLQHNKTVVYKYGASDADFQSLGGTPLLLWNTILEAKARGLEIMDFGRSDAENASLIAFKSRWGTQCSKLCYLRWSRKDAPEVTRRRSFGFIKQLFACMPDSVLQATGRILYRHVG
jgi:CelD/BcsL family acetyltransferase involved in cellulose biosynthesis